MHNKHTLPSPQNRKEKTRDFKEISLPACSRSFCLPLVSHEYQFPLVPLQCLLRKHWKLRFRRKGMRLYIWVNVCDRSPCFSLPPSLIQGPFSTWQHKLSSRHLLKDVPLRLEQNPLSLLQSTDSEWPSPATISYLISSPPPFVHQTPAIVTFFQFSKPKELFPALGPLYLPLPLPGTLLCDSSPGGLSLKLPILSLKFTSSKRTSLLATPSYHLSMHLFQYVVAICLLCVSLDSPTLPQVLSAIKPKTWSMLQLRLQACRRHSKNICWLKDWRRPVFRKAWG